MVRVTLVPVLVLDLDGTIRRSASGETFIKNAADVELFPDVEAKIWDFRDDGHLILGVTNQGGVAFGHKTWEQEHEEITATLNAFKRNPFHGVKSCYHHAGGTVPPFCVRSLFRKPSIGMLAEFEKEAYDQGYACDWDKSLFVGDRPEDEECAKNAGVEFTWAWDFFARERPQS